MNRTDIHDRSAGLREEGNGRLGEQESATQIHVKYKIPIFDHHIRETLLHLDSGIVDQNIDLRMEITQAAHCVLDLLGIAQIGGEEVHGKIRNLLGKLGSRRVSTGAVAVENEHACALALKYGGDGSSDTLG